jgi:DNA-binding IclR family transcriptional regulator
MRICIAEVQSLQEIRRVVPVGTAVPLHAGGTGEVLLAGLEAQDLNDVLSRAGIEGESRKALSARLREISERGWTMAVGAWTADIAGLAAPITEQGRTTAVLAVSGPSSRWNYERMREYIPAIVAAAAATSDSWHRQK